MIRTLSNIPETTITKYPPEACLNPNQELFRVEIDGEYSHDLTLEQMISEQDALHKFLENRLPDQGE